MPLVFHENAVCEPFARPASALASNCFDDAHKGSENWDLCWRQLTIELSATLKTAARQRPELAPILMEALTSALEFLLLFGTQDDFNALAEWLQEI